MLFLSSLELQGEGSLVTVPGDDYFAETFIHERVLTIEAEGYETLRFPLMPELGATNTYELRRK
jgi:hypothetical protein